MNVEFILGETRYVDFEVKNKKDEPFLITEANWKLKDFSEVLSSGSCQIVDSIISVLLTAEKRGRFTLELEYMIPPEKRKARVLINVT